MGKITQTKRLKSYYKIYEQIYRDPLIYIAEISDNTGVSRNAVAKYLQEMYADNILTGPSLCMKPHTNYQEYLYFLNFSDPFTVFDGLKEVPNVVSRLITFGDWNIVLVTSKLLNFSVLQHFETVVEMYPRGISRTPKVEWTTWESLAHIDINTDCEPDYHESRRNSLDWGPDEWKLFHVFKSNLRVKITPLLRKIGVRYDIYKQWKEELNDHCTIHTGFYPEGYREYMAYQFLFCTDRKPLLKSVFSQFPTTPVLTEMGDQLSVCVSVPFSDASKHLFCIIYNMRIQGVITEFSQAAALFYNQCKELHSDEHGAEP